MGQYQNPEWDILETMNKYGGSFIQQLARCYAAADLNNQVKLQTAFKDEFLKYDKMTTQVKQNANT